MTRLHKICVKLFVDVPKDGFVGMFANYTFKPAFIKPANWLFHFFVQHVPSVEWSQSVVLFLYKYSPDEEQPND